MTIFASVILGIVEGLTEFIPVSSTFHLIAASRIMGIPQSDFLKLFEVVIQSGAILSIIWLYKDKLLSNRVLQTKLAYSFIPTAIIGMILYKIIKGYFFENTLLQLSFFGLIGLIFLGLEWYLAKKKINLKKNLGDISVNHALLIGLFQVFSVIPGVSRSGSILVGMLILGFSRTSAAEYAFMLSLPTILAATALDLYQNMSLMSALTPDQSLSLLFGTISACFSALWVMKWLINYLSSHSLVVFGYYRLLVVIVLYYLL